MFTLNDQSSAAAAKRTPVPKTDARETPVRRPSEEAPHPASRFDAGTGQGTLFRMPKGEKLEHPVLDGATESRKAQRATENPFRGHRDPALGEWNYTRPHNHEDELAYEPERRRRREAEAAAHANDLEPRHWYKYDPFREERNRMKLRRKNGGADPEKAM